MSVSQPGTTRQVHSAITHTITLTLSTIPANEDASVPPEAWLDPDTGTDTEAPDAVPVPPTCHACGRPLFSRPTSMLLDLVVVALESLAEVKHALETEVLP